MEPSVPALRPAHRRKFLTQLSALAALGSSLSACGGGGDAVNVTVNEGALSLSDNTLTVTVGVPTTINITNRTQLPSGIWSITAPTSVTVSPNSGGSISPGESVQITVTTSAVGSFAVQVHMGALPTEALTVTSRSPATAAPTPGPTAAPTPAPTPSPSPAPTPTPSPAPATWNPTPWLSFSSTGASTLDLSTTLPASIRRGGIFVLAPSSAALPSGMSLSSVGILSLGSAAVGTTSNVVFVYSEP